MTASGVTTEATPAAIEARFESLLRERHEDGQAHSPARP